MAEGYTNKTAFEQGDAFGETVLFGGASFGFGFTAQGAAVSARVGSAASKAVGAIGRAASRFNTSKIMLFSKLGLGREVTPVDLFAFGPEKGLKGARAFQDFGTHPNPGVRFPLNGQVGLELPSGASTFAEPLSTPLQGHYHRLPAGTRLPRGFGLKADGIDVIPNSEHPPTHYTIFPTRGMWLDEFNDRLLALPWEYVGKKAK